jgi:hypothetical protein
VEKLKQAVAVIERLAAASTQVGEPADAVDSAKWELRMPAAALLAEGTLQQLIDLPVRFNLVLTVDAREIRISGEPRGSPVIQPSDRLFEIVADIDGFERAKERGDAQWVLKLFEDRELEAELAVVNDPAKAGFRWIRTEASLRKRLERSWLATLESIFSRGHQETLVVSDAGANALAAKDLHVCGPEAMGSAPEPGELTTFRFSGQWWDTHRSGLPPLPIPDGLVPAEEGSGSLQAIGLLTRGIGAALTWLWLADEVDASRDIPSASFEGQRLARFDLPACARDHVDDELALWTWAMEEQDPGRYYAVQRAVALAVFSSADLPNAARPALGSARTLLNALRQDQMAEAMATRRSVRDAGVAAGRAAADAGRTAGAKSLERVIVQAAAAAGILIAKSGDALSSSAATLLLVLVGALLVASAVIALAAEYPAAYGLLGSFRDDLSLYRDTLSEQDITAIEEMESLKGARRAITISLAVTVAILLAALVALGIAIAET